MSKTIIVSHRKGQKHSGKSNWDKLIQRPAPIVDRDNPELAGVPEVKFSKPGKIKT
ncbi:hypothetical protein [Thalassolituus oleivorans]|jgi:hypothetical protein|uniref:hypothetical protein n=1 Tax=Thalassolituus oleivorans TaxID=187493 RepID=UPI0023F111C4|nr:hypothetical protein [Thalassolituus oleivorans]